MKLVGNTPMIKINYEYNGKRKYLYTKLEYYNLTGSIKDRVAMYIIQNAIKNLNNHNNIRAEGAGAASLACALKFQAQHKTCICIISGGNIDDVLYYNLINK